MKASSLIKNINYDYNTQVLIIEFSNGRKYKYFNVDMSIIDKFKTAESLGAYFAQNIRGKYEFKLITE